MRVSSRLWLVMLTIVSQAAFNHAGAWWQEDQFLCEVLELILRDPLPPRPRKDHSYNALSCRKATSICVKNWVKSDYPFEAIKVHRSSRTLLNAWAASDRSRNLPYMMCMIKLFEIHILNPEYLSKVDTLQTRGNSQLDVNWWSNTMHRAGNRWLLWSKATSMSCCIITSEKSSSVPTDSADNITVVETQMAIDLPRNQFCLVQGRRYHCISVLGKSMLIQEPDIYSDSACVGFLYKAYWAKLLLPHSFDGKDENKHTGDLRRWLTESCTVEEQ